MKHTKLPWKCYKDPDSYRVRGAEDFYMLITSFRRYSTELDWMERWDPEQEANAQFIVTACNAHYELIDALESMLNLEAAAKRSPLFADLDVDYHCNKARQALKQAKGD